MLFLQRNEDMIKGIKYMFEHMKVGNDNLDLNIYTIMAKTAPYKKVRP
jgi:hypothetical protein